jgi:hypothetical protein
MLSQVFGHHIVGPSSPREPQNHPLSIELAGAIELRWLPVTMVSAPHHRVQDGLHVLFQVKFAPCFSG